MVGVVKAMVASASVTAPRLSDKSLALRRFLSTDGVRARAGLALIVRQSEWPRAWNRDSCVGVKGSVIKRQASLTTCNDTARAQDGRNAALGDLLLLANRSVGNADENLWLYRIEGSTITLLDGKNLKIDPSVSQAFNVCVELARHGNDIVSFAATEDALMRIGMVENDRLCEAMAVPVPSRFGEALNFEPSQALFSAADDNIHRFQPR
jgi:hypothetical protein